MQLRNGKIITISTAPVSTAAAVLDQPSLDERKQQFLAEIIFERRKQEIVTKLKKILMEENIGFVNSIALFGNIFTLLNENFEIISRPEFNASGRFIATIRDRIAYWNSNIPGKFFNFIMENPEKAETASKQVKNTQEILRRSEELLATIPA
jgi:hypothetical protein